MTLYSGLRSGLQSGFNPGSSVAGVTQDATSLKHVPANTTEWTTLRTSAGLSIGNPSSAWLCQEASGNLADTIGALTLVADGGTALYQQTVTGWARKAVKLADGTANYFDVTIPNVDTNNMFWLGFVGEAATPAAGRTLFYAGNARIQVESTGVYRAQSGANTVDGAAAFGSTVRPVGIKIGNTGAVTVLTDQEKITPTAGTVTGTTMFIGGAASTAPPANLLAMWRWTSAPSDADIKALYQALGFTVAW